MANGRTEKGDSMVVLSFRITAPDHQRGDILKSLRSLVGPTSAEAACAACQVFQEADNPNTICFVQAWSSSEALQRHVRSHQYRQLLSVLDLSHTAPEVRLDDVSPVGGGIEVLAAFAPDNSSVGTTISKEE
jgi:quinol monooxygenase YgiN